jgi:hypothetical protein
MTLPPLHACVHHMLGAQVCMTFHPEGTEWDEPEPVLVSEGFLGSTAGADGSVTPHHVTLQGNERPETAAAECVCVCAHARRLLLLAGSWPAPAAWRTHRCGRGITTTARWLLAVVR